MNDTSEIIEFIKRLKTIKKCINIEVIRCANAKIADDILKYTDFLDINASIKERLFCIEHKIQSKVICPVCKQNFVKFLRKQNKYADGCCHKCTVHSNAYKQKMLEKYGSESPNSSAIVKAHKVQSLLKKYNVTNSYQIPSVKAREYEKSLKHGVTHWTNPEKAKQTYHTKTGYKNPSQNPEVKQKKIQTCLNTLNCENPSQNPSIQERKIKTCLKNHGIKYGFLKNKHVVYNSISNLNKRMYQILDEAGIEYEKEFQIDTIDGSYRKYDILIPSKKLIIELNGDFWHANPKKFKADDIINLPHIGKTPVIDIWNRDAEKRALAESFGFIVKYIWEYDVKHKSAPELIKMIFSD